MCSELGYKYAQWPISFFTLLLKASVARYIDRQLSSYPLIRALSERASSSLRMKPSVANVSAPPTVLRRREGSVRQRPLFMKEPRAEKGGWNNSEKGVLLVVRSAKIHFREWNTCAVARRHVFSLARAARTSTGPMMDIASRAEANCERHPPALSGCRQLNSEQRRLIFIRN